MKFTYCSYRIEQALMIPFQNAKLSNDFRIHKSIVHAIDIHRKGMELVFIITKYCNTELININRILVVKMRFITMLNYNKHDLSLRLCNIFKANFGSSFCLLILISIVCLSLNLYIVSILYFK